MSIWISNTKTKGHDKVASQRVQKEEEEQSTLTGQAPETAARGSESFVRRRLLLQPLLRLLLLLYVACGQKASRRGSQTVGSPAQPQPAYSLVLSAHNLPLLLLLFGYQYAASVLATRRKQFPSQAKPSQVEARRSEALWPPAWPQVSGLVISI